MHHIHIKGEACVQSILGLEAGNPAAWLAFVREGRKLGEAPEGRKLGVTPEDRVLDGELEGRKLQLCAAWFTPHLKQACFKVHPIQTLP